jgi:hypothetical protein
MTRRQIVAALIFNVALLGAGSVGAAASQTSAVEAPGAIRGVVTRASTTEPMSGAQVTLQGGAANPQAIQTLLNTAADQGIVAQTEPGASTSQIIQALSSAAVARGFPLTTANLYTQLASLSGKTPPTTFAPVYGQFEISNVLPGVYELLARVANPAAQVAGGLPLAWGRARFEVRDTDVANLSIVVSPPSEVTGTLVAANAEKLPPSLRVQLLPDDASIRIPAFQSVLARSAMVGPDGTFKIPAVPEGHYRVMTVAGLTPDLYFADVRHKAMSVFDAGFDVRPGENDPIQVVVGSGAGTISGLVQAGATVALVPEAARRGNLALYLSAVSDASGRFVMRGVPPGDYKLFAWESVRPFAYQNAEFIAKDEERGRLIHVGQGTTVNAELTIIR